MATLATLRSKIQTSIFDKIGRSLTLKKVFYSEDKWGDRTVYEQDSETVQAVPFDDIKSRKTFHSFGVSKEGETRMIIPYTTSITFHVGSTTFPTAFGTWGTPKYDDYIVTYRDLDYDVVNVEKFLYDGGNLAYLLTLKQQLS